MTVNKSSKKLKPQNTKHPDLAREYNRLADSVYDHPKVNYPTPDGGTVNLMSFNLKWIWSRLPGISEKEKEDVKAIWEQIHNALREMARLKRQIFEIHKGNGMLSEDRMMESQKALLLEWFGQLNSEENIQEKLAGEGIVVHLSLIRKFRQRHKAEIEKLQDEYEKEWHTVGLTRKRSRLDQLVYLYNKSKVELDSKSGDKILPYSKEMRGILEQVRKEVEGDKIQLDINGNINVTATLQLNQTVESLYANLNFMSLLVGRTAARFGVDPTVLMYKLTSSWYANFTGFKRNNKMMEEQPVFPSQMIYNWEDIKNQNASYEASVRGLEEKCGIQEAKIVEEYKEKKLSLKELMRQKEAELSKAKGDLLK